MYDDEITCRWNQERTPEYFMLRREENCKADPGHDITEQNLTQSMTMFSVPQKIVHRGKKDEV